jgi:hypothetical protein
VNGVVGIVGCADQELEIERMLSSVDDVLFDKRIHVMNDELCVNIVTIHTEIACLISKNCFLAKLSPFARRVEPLIDPSVETERLTTDLAFQREVLESFLEGFEPNELGI